MGKLSYTCRVPSGSPARCVREWQRGSETRTSLNTVVPASKAAMKGSSRNIAGVSAQRTPRLRPLGAVTSDMSGSRRFKYLRDRDNGSFNLGYFTWCS